MNRCATQHVGESHRPWDWEALGRLVRERARDAATRHLAELGGVLPSDETGIVVAFEDGAS
jgi:hypothetical protein